MGTATAHIGKAEILDADGDAADVADRRATGLVRVREALSRLRGLDTVGAVLDRGVQELCRTCGFQRAIVLRLEETCLYVAAGHAAYDAQWGPAMVAYSADFPVVLEPGLLETEMLRRRAPGLILDAQNHPRVHRPMADLTGTVAYVAAPIAPQGRVIGMVHGDQHRSGRRVDIADRDILWAFAEGFGFAIQGAALSERLRDLAIAPIQLGATRAGAAPAPPVPPPPGAATVLTPREIEVVALMASGATNAEIAERLVISHDTVKSHVRHVLRKLRAANRAEAVSRYLGLAGE